MFTLRIIEEIRENENTPFEQVIENHELGKSYAKLKQGCTKEFDIEIEKMKEQLQENWPDINVKTDVETLICGDNGEQFFIMKETPLVRHDYFIMTENGATFERL